MKALRARLFEDLSMIDVEIEKVASTLLLKRQRDEIQESIDDFNIILAPVRCLSVDVLSVILNYCLATHRDPIMSSSEAPILLTHICRDWRSIALSTPRLWSRLCLPPLETAGPFTFLVKCTTAHCEEVQRWLRLSTACPLSITIWLDKDFLNQRLLDSIIQSSSRWQKLKLSHLDRDSSKIILSLSADDLCMLRELRLGSLGYTCWGYKWYKCALFTTPSLRSISVACVGNELFKGIPSNWKNLNQLLIHTPTIAKLANKLLCHCHNLVSCVLQICGPWDNNDTMATLGYSFLPEYSFLPLLEFISLRGDYEGCNELYRRIDAPSLRHLDCEGGLPRENDSEDSEPGMFSLLRSIICNSLETLVISYPHLTRENAINYYNLTPSLKRLVLGEPLFTWLSRFADSKGCQQVITPLYETKNSSSLDSVPTFLLPSLEVFEVYGIKDVNDSVLLEFITTRIDATKSSTGVPKLRKVVVGLERPRAIDNIVPQALAYAQAAGMELKLKLKYEGEFDHKTITPQS